MMLGKWNLLRIALNELRIADCGLRIFFRRRVSAISSMAVLKSRPVTSAPLVREGKGEVAGAAAQIERAIAGLNGGQFNDAAFPAPVQAEALQVVEQIIAPGDGGKKIVDLRRALFAGDVETVAHASV